MSFANPLQSVAHSTLHSISLRGRPSRLDLCVEFYQLVYNVFKSSAVSRRRCVVVRCCASQVVSATSYVPTYVGTYVRPAIVAAAVAIAHVWYGLIKRAPTDGSARSVWLLSA